MRSDFENCGGPYDLAAEHTKTNWEDAETTGAEHAVIRYLADLHPKRVAGARLLHLGLGNGAVYGELGAALKAYVGTTISQPEIDRFESRYPNAENASLVLANKHDPRTYPATPGPFDLVIDVNLKSFACCQDHYEAYIDFIIQSLAPGGEILTAQTGLDFGWHGKTRRGFTPGMSLDPLLAANRTLGEAGVRELAAAHGLSLTATEVDTVERGEPARETVWSLRKQS